MNRDKVSFDRPLQLGHLLAGVIRRRGVAEKSAMAELNRMWCQVVDERIAQKSAVRRLRNRVLEIGVRNGAVLEELSSYHRHDVLKALQSRFPRSGIDSLKFVRIR